jgi:hypothetical protein
MTNLNVWYCLPFRHQISCLASTTADTKNARQTLSVLFCQIFLCLHSLIFRQIKQFFALRKGADARTQLDLRFMLNRKIVNLLHYRDA